MRSSIPYRDETFVPRFGPPTCKSNFCEEDFVVSSRIAEIANTLTSLVYVVYAIRGLWRNRNESGSSSSENMYVGLAFVGVCSALFHGLLKYWAQMSDDLSMIVASATVFHQAITYGRAQSLNKVFSTALVALVVAETVYHMAMNEVVVHELSFLVLIVSAAFRTRHLVRERVAVEEDGQKLRTVIGLGAGCMAFGYVLSQMDFRYCTELAQLNRAIGMPWSFIFEFHGWWHVLTAVGAYTFMALVESLTQEHVVVSTTPFGPVVRWLHDGEEKAR